MTQPAFEKVDWLHWAKRLKSDVALKFLIAGASEDSRLSAVLQRHIELGNVIRVDGAGLQLNPKAERDAFHGLVRFD